MVLVPNKSTAFGSKLDIFFSNLRISLLLVASISNMLITWNILWHVVHQNAEITSVCCFKKLLSETKMNQRFHILETWSTQGGPVPVPE